MTAILESEIKVYATEYRDEKEYGFFIKLDSYRGERQFATSSKEAIEAFISVLEFAERIQDKGVQYIIGSSYLKFPSEEDAQQAASYLYDIIEDTPTEIRHRLLYEFNKKKFFGRKGNFVDDIAARTGISPKAVSDEELENELLTYSKAIEGNIIAYYGDRDYKIVGYDVRTGNLTADDGAVLDVAECDLTYLGD